MSRTSVTATHYARLLRLWPKDLLRPEVQFQQVLRARSNPDTGAALPSTRTSNRKNASATPADRQTREEQLDLALGKARGRPADEGAQVNALYALVEERFMQAYPLPQSVRRPQSDPEYYDRLLKQLEETPQRGWFDNFSRRLRGMVRFS